jgi:hypothetical protein
MLMNDDRNIDPMVAELLSQHALQSLDAEGAARLQRMLAEDPALSNQAEELCRVVDMLALSTQCTPPPRLRERVLAATRTAANSQPVVLTPKVRASAQPRRWHTFASLTLAAAASVACAVLLVERQEQREELDALRTQSAKQTAQLNRQLELKTKAASMLLEPNVVIDFPLGGRNPAATAMGYVLLDLDARRASIAVVDLPAVPAGHSYHLWAVLESQGKVPCGRFTPETDGSILNRFSIPVNSYTSPIQRLILTVEPDSDQMTPRGTTVMTS